MIQTLESEDKIVNRRKSNKSCSEEYFAGAVFNNNTTTKCLWTEYRGVKKSCRVVPSL